MNGNYFLLPNNIFDEGLTPTEFVVYSFFISRKDKNNQSYYSVPHIAEHCGICENSCRKVIKNLTEKGLVYNLLKLCTMRRTIGIKFIFYN